MKYFFLFSLCLLISKETTAQNTKFIQTTISDTIHVVPDEIVYSFSLYPTQGYEENYETENFKPEKSKRLEEEAKASLENILIKEKISFEPKANSTFEVKCSSYKKLNALIEKINNAMSKEYLVLGKIIDLTTKNKDIYQKKLMELCYEKGKAKAQHLAKISGTNLGQIIEIIDYTDGTSEAEAYRSTYLAELYAREGVLVPVTVQNVILSCYLTLKFEINH